jgi:hypothetical protein
MILKPNVNDWNGKHSVNNKNFTALKKTLTKPSVSSGVTLKEAKHCKIQPSSNFKIMLILAVLK